MHLLAKRPGQAAQEAEVARDADEGEASQSQEVQDVDEGEAADEVQDADEGAPEAMED